MTPENLHVTLAFLGETPDDRLPEAAGAVAEAAAGIAPFRLAFDRAGRFPERGRPRVVWLGIGEGLGDIALVGARVAEALRRRSLRFDDRPLAPHLTLARVRDDASGGEAKRIAAAVDGLVVPPLAVGVAEIAVVRSVLSPQGPRYTPQTTAKLPG